jgi:hypothetical protein
VRHVYRRSYDPLAMPPIPSLPAADKLGLATASTTALAPSPLARAAPLDGTDPRVDRTPQESSGCGADEQPRSAHGVTRDGWVEQPRLELENDPDRRLLPEVWRTAERAVPRRAVPPTQQHGAAGPTPLISRSSASSLADGRSGERSGGG